MNYTEKIFWTIIFGIGGLFLPIIMNYSNDNLKKGLQKSNPELVKNQGWFFSKTKNNIIKWVILLLISGWIILIWTTDIKILEN